MLERLIVDFKARDGVVFDTLGGYAEKWRAANPLDQWLNSGSVHIGAAAE